MIEPAPALKPPDLVRIMPNVTPKLKDSVQFFPFENDLYHVYDANTSRHFKLGQQEVNWMKLLDGSTTLDGLRGKIPVEYFEKFLENVQRLGLLEGSETTKKDSLLKIKLLNVDPTGIIDRMGNVPAYYRTFLEWMSLPILILNMLALAALVPQIDRIRASLEFSAWTIAFYFFIILFTGLVHEGSHALVARSFKVQVPKLGIMLFMLHPSLYADVSGINLLAQRSARIKVLLAGVMGNNLLLFIGIGMTFLPLNPIAQQFAILFITINFTLMFVNLIPFVEFDGYFIFQELVGEPRFSRNALVSMFGTQSKRIEYALYFHISQVFQFMMIMSLLILVRRGVLLLWDSMWVNIGFLIMILASYPALIFYRLKHAR